MAFKILSQDEMAFLSERERKVYEQAYNEYLERTAFVEKLEKLEKVKMPKVSIKKKCIKKIKTPTVPVIREQGYKADMTAGVNLLNVTKKINRAVEASTKSSILENYRASLPDVFVSTPDEVSVGNDEPFVIERLSSVPKATPLLMRYDAPKFRTALPKLGKFGKPELEDIRIGDYSVQDLPSVSMELPKLPKSDANVAFKVDLPTVKADMPHIEGIHFKQTDLIPLQSITVAEPVDIKAEFADYEISLPVANVVNAPTINYVRRDLPPANLSHVIVKPVDIKAEMTDYKITQPMANIVHAPKIHYEQGTIPSVNLLPVSIPERKDVPGEIKIAEIDLPEAKSINAPRVSLKVEKVKITKLKEVCMPVLAPEIHIAAPEVKEMDAPKVSAPKEIHYSAPDYKVDLVRIPMIKVPTVDTKAELEMIMSKIR